MPENNQILSVEGQLVGMPLAGPESFSPQQLDYLKRALGVDETVLWESGTGATSGSFSESPANFEYIKVYCNRTGSNSANNLPGYTEVLTRDGIPTSFVVVNGLFDGADIFMPVCVFNLSSSGFSLVKGRNVKLGSSAVSVEVASFTNVGILKVVGCVRKSA